VSTRIGLLNPNSAMLAAICATWVSEWVRGFRAYRMSLSIGRVRCAALTDSQSLSRVPFVRPSFSG